MRLVALISFAGLLMGTIACRTVDTGPSSVLESSSEEAHLSKILGCYEVLVAPREFGMTKELCVRDLLADGAQSRQNAQYLFKFDDGRGEGKSFEVNFANLLRCPNCVEFKAPIDRLTIVWEPRRDVIYVRVNDVGRKYDIELAKKLEDDFDDVEKVLLPDTHPEADTYNTRMDQKRIFKGMIKELFPLYAVVSKDEDRQWALLQVNDVVYLMKKFNAGVRCPDCVGTYISPSDEGQKEAIRMELFDRNGKYTIKMLRFFDQ